MDFVLFALIVSQLVTTVVVYRMTNQIHSRTDSLRARHEELWNDVRAVDIAATRAWVDLTHQETKNLINTFAGPVRSVQSDMNYMKAMHTRILDRLDSLETLADITPNHRHGIDSNPIVM